MHGPARCAAALHRSRCRLQSVRRSPAGPRRRPRPSPGRAAQCGRPASAGAVPARQPSARARERGWDGAARPSPPRSSSAATGRPPVRPARACLSCECSRRSPMRIDASRCRRGAPGAHLWVFLSGAVLPGFFLCVFAAGLCVTAADSDTWWVWWRCLQAGSAPATIFWPGRRLTGGCRLLTGVVTIWPGDDLLARRLHRRRERRSHLDRLHQCGTGCDLRRLRPGRDRRLGVQHTPVVAAGDLEQRRLVHAACAAALQLRQSVAYAGCSHFRGDREHRRMVEARRAAALGRQRAQRRRGQRRRFGDARRGQQVDDRAAPPGWSCSPAPCPVSAPAPGRPGACAEPVQ